MLHPSQLNDYQRRAVNHQLVNPRSFLWLFMGSGKTIITLTTIKHLLGHGVIKAALVCGPLRVIQSVWEKESLKWTHTRGMSFSMVHGSPEQRITALFKDADVYLINYENIPWMAVQLEHYFIKRGHALPFDMLVLDESSKMKNSNSQRVKAMDPLLPYFKYRTGLTGTPATNGLIDLHGQFLVVDDGQRLGLNLKTYKANYFKSAGYGGYKFECSDSSADRIHRQVADIVLEMKEEDYIKLPDFITIDVKIDLPPQARKKYEALEREFFVELDSGTELEVFNEAAKINKLLQFSNGSVYTNTETRAWETVHDGKLDALEDILEEAAGNPVLLGYIFRPDAVRIQKRFPFAVNLTGLTGQQFNKAIADFAESRIKLLIGHPASIGHGTDGLQHGGRILTWFGIPWSLELFLQLNKRLHRRGQEEPVRAYRILGRNTMDNVVKDVLTHKNVTQATLREAVAKYRKEKGL